MVEAKKGRDGERENKIERGERRGERQTERGRFLSRRKIFVPFLRF